MDPTKLQGLRTPEAEALRRERGSQAAWQCPGAAACPVAPLSDVHGRLVGERPAGGRSSSRWCVLTPSVDLTPGTWHLAPGTCASALVILSSWDLNGWCQLLKDLPQSLSCAGAPSTASWRHINSCWLSSSAGNLLCVCVDCEHAAFCQEQLARLQIPSIDAWALTLYGVRLFEHTSSFRFRCQPRVWHYSTSMISWPASLGAWSSL